MAQVRILYWKEIPLQVQASGKDGQASQLLDSRFQQGVDAVAMFDGSSGTDDYLLAFEWGAYISTKGTAKEAVSTLAEEFNQKFPEDFVKRVCDNHKTGQREPRASAIDHWKDEYG